VGSPSREIQVSASVKSDGLWDHGAVRCCSAVQVVAVGAGERVGAGASRKLFHNSTPKSRLREEGEGTRLGFQPSLWSGAGTEGLPDSRKSCAVAPHTGEAVNEEI